MYDYIILLLDLVISPKTGGTFNFETSSPWLPSPPRTPKTAGVTADERGGESTRNIRLMKRISSFAKPATEDYEAKIRLVNSMERRKINTSQNDRSLSLSISQLGSPLLQSMVSVRSPKDSVRDENIFPTFREEISKSDIMF